MKSSSLVHPPEQSRFSFTLRQAMRKKIKVILQRTSEASIQEMSFSPDYLEAELMKLAKSEEEYLNPRDLEVRVYYLKKELEESISRGHGINALPDFLITQILLWLPTKDSIKTSVLSKRWRKLWLEVPGLELHNIDFPPLSNSVATKNFIDRFLDINHSRMQKFKLKCNVYLLGITELIAEVINRGVHQLDLHIDRDDMPMEIYKSKSLVSLKLVNIGMANPDFVVSLPCLKIMHLENVMYSKEDPLIIEKVISGCPVLEDLTVFRAFDDNVPVLRVRSPSLKRFCVEFYRYIRIGGIDYAVEIDAPGLKYMDFRDGLSDNIVAKNLSSLFTIDIDTKFSVVLGTPLRTKKAIICDFLNGVSSARHMIISQPTMKVLYPYLKQGPVAKFHSLSRLEASFCTVLLEVLPHFLDGFPNLRHLTLHLLYLDDLEPENLELTVVPLCLLRTLKCVEVKEVITAEKAGMKRAKCIKRTKVSRHKKKIWTEVVRYILENSLVLKKLILRFSSATNSILDISEALPTFTKRSPGCEISSIIWHLLEDQ